MVARSVIAAVDPIPRCPCDHSDISGQWDAFPLEAFVVVVTTTTLFRRGSHTDYERQFGATLLIGLRQAAAVTTSN